MKIFLPESGKNSTRTDSNFVITSVLTPTVEYGFFNQILGTTLDTEKNNGIPKELGSHLTRMTSSQKIQSVLDVGSYSFGDDSQLFICQAKDFINLVAVDDTKDGFNFAIVKLLQALPHEDFVIIQMDW